MDLAQGTMVTTNVRLIQPLAHGGMGSVWLADHLGLEAKVAVKFISPELVKKEPSLRERFKREASISAKLRSVHVVQTFDHGAMSDGTQYIVMELLEGVSLTTLCSRRQLTPREVGIIVAQVCKVLSRAHDLGIVHRDIKPDNLFISSGDYDLFVKVLDFGIAKQTALPKNVDVVTKTGAVVGSPEFMSPEQAINSKEVDHRTDLFSLAVVAYYALTGVLPFEDAEDKPFWVQLTSGDFVPVTERMASLPAELDGFFKRALAPKPKDRFQTAKEMMEAWNRIVGAPIADATGSNPISDLSADTSQSLELSQSDDSAPVIQVRASPSEDFSEQQTMRWKRPDNLDLPAIRELLGSAPAEAGVARGRNLSPTVMTPWSVPPPEQKTWFWPLMALAAVLLAAAAAAAAVLIWS
jgi:eukaryotic-like serine/threonine-protein kinase